MSKRRKLALPTNSRRGGPYELNSTYLDGHDVTYPYNKVFKFESGHTLEFNNTPNSEYIILRHAKGAMIAMDKDGNIQIDTGRLGTYKGNRKDTVAADCEVSIGGDYKLNVESNMEVRVGGSLKYVVEGDLEWQIGGGVTQTPFGPLSEQDQAENEALNKEQKDEPVDPEFQQKVDDLRRFYDEQGFV